MYYLKVFPCIIIEFKHLSKTVYALYGLHDLHPVEKCSLTYPKICRYDIRTTRPRATLSRWA
jgi:hypothetical protein